MRSTVIEAAISIDQVSFLPAIHNSHQCGNRIDSHNPRLSPSTSPSSPQNNKLPQYDEQTEVCTPPTSK